MVEGLYQYFVRCKSYGSVRVHRARGCVIRVPETLEPCSSMGSWWAETVDFASPRYRKCLVIIPPFFFLSRGSWQLELFLRPSGSTSPRFAAAMAAAMQMNH